MLVMDSPIPITSDELEGDAQPQLEIPSFPLDRNTSIMFILLAFLPALLKAAASAWWSYRHRHRKFHPALSPVTLTRANPLNGRVVRSTISTPRYGLALGEALSDASDDEPDDDDDLTTKELRKLQHSKEFATWCRKQKLQEHDLESIYCRMRTFTRLRNLHPPSFWLLCHPDSLISLESQDPGSIVLLLEYLVSMSINVSVLGFLGWCVWRQVGLTSMELTAGISAAYFLCIGCWLNGRPTAGFLLFMWYEDVVWGHGVSASRAVLANLLETFYLVGTLGLGIFASLFSRWRDGQSVGERIAGIRPVIEKKVRLDQQ